MRALLFLLLLGSFRPTARAHGDLHDRIAGLTGMIATNAQAAELLMERGELHRLHCNWEAARMDFDRVAEVDPHCRVLDLCRARLLRDTGNFEDAAAHLDRFLAIEPDHVEAHYMRGQMRRTLGQTGAAVADFTRAIDLSSEPKPDYYLARAETTAATGDFRAALVGLDEGIARIGSLVTLQVPAIDLEMRWRNFDGALRRLDLLSSQSPRKESWLARRGEILIQAGRPEEARAAFRQALAAIDSLPSARAGDQSMLALRKRIGLQLETLQPATLQDEDSAR